MKVSRGRLKTFKYSPGAVVSPETFWIRTMPHVSRIEHRSGYQRTELGLRAFGYPATYGLDAPIKSSKDARGKLEPSFPE
ncbi:MAG TPA: hypothetical protein VK589_12920 [Chryseolinea sp.]|nr:hypothetical protein [Chryseolinea sp.]